MGRVSIHLTWRCIAGVAGCVVCQHEDNVLVPNTKPASEPLSVGSWAKHTGMLAQQQYQQGLGQTSKTV